MDSKIKKVKTQWLRLIIFVLCPLSIILCPSCKENNWLDWKTQNEIWLENNKHQPGVKVTSSGLQYRIIADPTPQDARPNESSTIVCDYTVKLINGYEIQKDVKGASLDLSTTIPGFTEGCHKIHSHGDIELFIPAYLGYDREKYEANKYDEAEGFGTEGTQSYIPPYSTLIYTVHICGVTGN